MAKLKRWSAVVAWNVCLAIVLVGVVEVMLRFSRLDAVRNPAAANPAGYYTADPKLGVRITPDFPESRFEFRGPGHPVFSNNLGCFDQPFRLPPGEPYILAIGDSFTWGYNPLEAKWTSIVEERTGIRVLKCGVPGTGTRHQLEDLKRLLARLPHAPTSVIHLYDTTDFNDDFVFPGDTVSDGVRIQDFEHIRLSDGWRVPLRGRTLGDSPGQIYGTRASKRKSATVLGSLVRMGLAVESQIESRRTVIEGAKPEFLKWRYEFNLLLLDPEAYPYVARRLEDHIATLREMRDLVGGLGASYALFHTNSFRLPENLPLVRRLESYFEAMPEFLGRMPELDRHRFDPHWNAESEVRVAEFMLEKLRNRDRERERTIAQSRER